MSSSQKERGWGNQLLTIIEGNEGKKKGVVISPFFLSLSISFFRPHTRTLYLAERKTHTHMSIRHTGAEMKEPLVVGWSRPRVPLLPPPLAIRRSFSICFGSGAEKEKRIIVVVVLVVGQEEKEEGNDKLCCVLPCVGRCSQEKSAQHACGKWFRSRGIKESRIT